MPYLWRLYEICRKTTKTVDYHFQCNKKSCKSGQNQVQLRKGSWFEGAIISYRKSILLAYCFLNKLTYKHAIQETSISSTDDSDEERVLLTSSETVSDYYNYCRDKYFLFPETAQHYLGLLKNMLHQKRVS